MGRIFPQVDLGLMSVIMVVVILVVNEPSRCVVIMLVHHGQFQAVGQGPAFFVVRSFAGRSRRADDHDVGIFGPYGFINHRKPFREHAADEVFVAQSDVFQVERFGMSGLGPFASPPCGFGIPVGIFNQVEHVLYVLPHLLHRDAALLAVGRHEVFGMMARASDTGILAGHACGHDRQRFGTDVLAKLEILEVAQTARLVVTPDVGRRFSGFQRADGLFPMIDVVHPVPMCQTSAGEADETRTDVGNGLRQVGAKPVLPSLERLLWEQ